MTVEVKEAAVYIRKLLLVVLKSVYSFAASHPFVSSFALLLLFLHNCCSSLFVFLFSSSPVFICTALLLGTLLCYGEPIVPDIEDDDNAKPKVASLKVELSANNLFVKEDDLPKLDGREDRRAETEEVSVKDSASDGCDVFFASSSLMEETNKSGGHDTLHHGFEENREILVIEQPEVQIDEPNKCGEEYVLDQGFDENRLNFMQREAQVRITEVSSGFSEGIEGLMVNINKPELDDWIDSSLSSPWQPHNKHNAACSDSDHSESSSPDASMSDILPLLDELHPLLHSEATHHAPQSMYNSDLEHSQYHESDDDSVERQDEPRLAEKDYGSMVVTWTADDQKNVMVLGSSDLERNRRLESLMARRRARKNQLIIFEKNLIDLHSNDMAMEELSRFHHQVSPISAPWKNPFDFPHNWKESTGLATIPGSAPSILPSQKNPFDFRCDGDDGDKEQIRESLSRAECLHLERGLFLRKNESFVPHSSFPSDVTHAKFDSSGLTPSFFAERMDSEGSDSDYLQCQQPSKRNNTMLMPVQDAGTWSGVVKEDENELPEQELQESTALTISIQDTKSAERYSQTYETESVNIQSKLAQGDHFVDPNTSTIEECHQSIDSSCGIHGGEIELDSYMTDAGKHEIVNDIQDELILFSSLEEIKSHGFSLPEQVENQGHIAGDLKASRGSKSVEKVDANVTSQSGKIVGNSSDQSAFQVYDSSPSGSEKFLASICLPNATLLSSGRGDHPTSYIESDGQEDTMEVISYSRALDEDTCSKEAVYEIVHGRKAQDPASSSTEPGVVSPDMNHLDENVGLNKDFGGPGTSLTLDLHL